MTRLGLFLVLIVASGLTLAAQQSAPAFEVASGQPLGRMISALSMAVPD